LRLKYKIQINLFKVSSLSDTLQQAELKISSDESCKSKFKRYINVKRQICDEKTDIDSGDTCSVNREFILNQEFSH